MKLLRNLTRYFFIPAFIVSGIYWVVMRNERILYLPTCERSDAATIRKISEMAEENFLSPEYFTVFAKSENGPCCFVYYNAVQEALWICEDPGSGWSGSFDLSKERLKIVAQRGLSFSQLRELLPNMSQQRQNATYPKGW